MVLPGQGPLHEGLRGGGWQLWRTQGPFWARLLCSACPAPQPVARSRTLVTGQVGTALRLLVNQAKDFGPLCDQEPRAGESQTLADRAGGRGRRSAARGRALGGSGGHSVCSGLTPDAQGRGADGVWHLRR